MVAMGRQMGKGRSRQHASQQPARERKPSGTFKISR